MATFNCRDLSGFAFPAESLVTTTGGTFTALANEWYGVPALQGDTITSDYTGDVMCMLVPSRTVSGFMVQVKTVDEIRQSV